jgi:hypothetical protein
MLAGGHEQFQRIRSPLARLAKQYGDDAEARSWFAQHYPAYVHPSRAVFLCEDAFFDLAAERIASDPLHSVVILRGLSRPEADRFLRRATQCQDPV